MNWSFPIGTFRGTEVRIHATFFLLLAWVLAVAWIEGGPASALVNVVFILAIFACVVLHEFGHVLMARRFGVKTPDITLLPIGGMARLERIPENPREEILVAIAGPAVNVAIWFLIALVIGFGTAVDALRHLGDPSQDFLARLGAVNLLLVLFNLIPAFPMDGGRVFRAALSLAMDRVQATRVAAAAGQIIAFLFGFLGLTGGSPILILIAVFIFFAAGAESSDAAVRGKAHGALARDAMITAFEALSPDDTIETAAQAVLRTTQAEFPVVGPDGRLMGVLTRTAILTRGEGGQGRTVRVAEAMQHDIPQVRLDAPLETVLDAMAQHTPPAVAVTDRSGAFIGYITRENVGEWFILARQSPARA